MTKTEGKRLERLEAATGKQYTAGIVVPGKDAYISVQGRRYPPKNYLPVLTMLDRDLLCNE